MTYLDPQPNDDHADNADEVQFKRECQAPLAEMMGNLTSQAEANAMADILSEQGLDLYEISDEDFFALIPSAIARAKTDERDWDNLEREENENV